MELAVVLPVILMVIVIAADALVFVSECARFDHLAAQSVLAQGASPANGEYDIAARVERIHGELGAQFPDEKANVLVAAEEQSGISLWGSTSFTCTLEIAPWPFPRSVELFGMHVPTAFTHSYTLALDTYTPGDL